MSSAAFIIIRLHAFQVYLKRKRDTLLLIILFKWKCRKPANYWISPTNRWKKFLLIWALMTRIIFHEGFRKWLECHQRNTGRLIRINEGLVSEFIFTHLYLNFRSKIFCNRLRMRKVIFTIDKRLNVNQRI